MAAYAKSLLLLLVLQKGFGGGEINRLCTEERKMTRYEELCCIEKNLGQTFVETKEDGRISYTLCSNEKPNDCPGSCSDILKHKPDAESGYYRITVTSNNSSKAREEEVYCDMQTTNCLESGWTRIAYINMSTPGTVCPPGLTEKHYSNVTYGLCINNHTNSSEDMSCDGTTFDTYGISYSKVCGRVYGYQHGIGLAFDVPEKQQRVTEAYISGVSITKHGQHVWTFASGNSEEITLFDSNYCPCSEYGPVPSPPSFVGNNYICESGRAPLQGTDDTNFLGIPNYQQDGLEESEDALYLNDKLWDGLDCNSDEAPCCKDRQLPFFTRTLDETTRGPIDLRVCGGKPLCDISGDSCSYRDTPIELIELYIK